MGENAAPSLHMPELAWFQHPFVQMPDGTLAQWTRKPLDMSVKQHIMHSCRINTEEIPRCPPVFDNTQCLSDDEIIDILLFGTPKSWQ